MKHLVDLEKLDRLDTLIRRKATGCPDVLAQRLGISRSSLFEIISFLREVMKAPIRYNHCIPSYEYIFLPKFHLNFDRDRLNEIGMCEGQEGVESNKKDDDN